MVRVVKSYDEQLKLWIDGESVHVKVGKVEELGPDFSCCKPKLLAPKSTRDKYSNGSEEARNKMLAGFLGKLVESEDLKAKIVGP